MTRVSVVIPTKDRPLAVADAVRSVFAGTYQEFELFVVDQSTDGSTGAALASFAADPRFHYYQNHERAPGAASSRNIGIALSTGEIVAIIDDDVTVCSDWMSNLVAEFARDPGLQFICGKLTAPPYDWQLGFIPSFDPEHQRLSNWTMPMTVAGANFSMRRMLFDRVGGYDEVWGPGSPYGVSDDGDIAFRIARSGARWKASSTVEVVHTHGFRTVADGVALRRSYEHGLGCNFGRFARRGDLIAGLWFMRHVLWEMVTVVLPNVLLGRRPTHFGRVRDWLNGFWQGFSLSPNAGFVSAAELSQLRRRLLSRTGAVMAEASAGT